MNDIIKYPDARLRQTARPVDRFDETLHLWLETMANTMYDCGGVGLAAPQVGLNFRVFIIDISTHDSQFPRRMEFINPSFISRSGSTTWEEGCLSLPGITEKVSRSAEICADYFDREGKRHRIEAQALMAVAFQHELDHLDGKLFIDRLSPIKRILLKRKIEKGLKF